MQSGVRMERATTLLVRDVHDTVSVRGERAPGGGVHVAEEPALDAAEEDRHRSGGMRNGCCRSCARVAPLRKVSIPWSRSRQHTEREPDSVLAGQPIGDATHETRGRHGRTSQRRLGHDREDRARQQRHAARHREPVAGLLQSRPVDDTGRADGLTGTAAEATVQMERERRVGRNEVPAGQPLHEIDAAARAVGLVTGLQEGGTTLQAEAAMHARRQSGEPVTHCSAPTATVRTLPGSNERRSWSTSRPTPSR